MKIFLSLALACTGLIALTIACDSASNVTECTVDADCVDVDATFICGEDGICGADTSECAADLDCQIIDGADGADCTASSDCEDNEGCAEGFDGAGFCLVTGGADICGLVDGFDSESLPEKGGAGDRDFCVSTDGTCTDAACTF